MQELEPFYFGDQNTSLYGCFHAAIAAQRKVATVMCPPFGDEAIRIHRAYKQLALRLSRAGFPVMRFDYFGWGDSAGEDIEATLSRWEADIALAIEEVKKRSSVEQVVLLGLRLGSTLALKIATQRKDIAGVVLWEPIPSGKDYLHEEDEAHQGRLNYFLTDPIYSSGLGEGATEILGFVLSATLRAEIEQLNMFDFNYLNQPSQALIVEKATTEAAVRLKDFLQNHSFQVVYECQDDPAIWGEDPDKALIPGQTFKAVMAWFNEKFI